jgi:undecaprenyl-diphosphatase
MTVVQAFVLGLLQGLTEFLPVSSSAHLTLAPWVFGWPDPGLAFDVALHIGTLVALLWYFRVEWGRLTGAALRLAGQGFRVKTAEERLVVYIALATIPGAVAGVLLERRAEEQFRSPLLIAGALAVMGTVLWAVDRFAPTGRKVGDLTWRDALVIGLAQVLALIPGVSRSGSTITAGRALRMNRESAAVFSFLLSMPLIAGAGLKKLPHLLAGGITAPLAVGVVTAAISSWIAITIVLRYVKSHSYGAFAAYRLVLAAVVIALWYLRGSGRA